MNLVKEILGTVVGAQIFGIISMIIFIVIFFLVIIHAYSLRKDEVRDYSKLPLEDNEADQKRE